MRSQNSEEELFLRNTANAQCSFPMYKAVSYTQAVRQLGTTTGSIDLSAADA